MEGRSRRTHGIRSGSRTARGTRRPGPTRPPKAREEQRASEQDHCMNVKRDAGLDDARRGKQPEHQRKTHGNKRRAGEQEEPVWRVEQHESEATPAIAETARCGARPRLSGHRTMEISVMRAPICA